MNIQAEKLEIMKMLLETKDESILRQIKAFFYTRPAGWFEELPEEIRKGVEQGLKESARGEGTPHSKVKREYSKWLRK